MPVVYLSPSTQDWNPYVTGSGSEEYWMNRIADAMEPYLRSNGIRYKRNDPDTSAAAAIRDANGGAYDFYLALHSNASGSGEAQTVRGILVFYYPTSAEGKRGAELIAKNLASIYPLPQNVSTRATTALGEVSRPRFPSALAEIGYHDNYSDALWVEGHVEPIARQLTLSLTEFFSLPFVEKTAPRRGTVRLQYGTLNLRERPDREAAITANIPNGAGVTVYGEWQGWYVVHYEDRIGYAAAAFIDV